MNLKEIKEMLKLMEENNLMEMEIEKDGSKIRLKKNSSGVEQIITSPAARVVTNDVHQTAKEAEEQKQDQAQLEEITSPMVGTFYRAPSPENPPFVEIDTVIQPGDVLCIIEAMKLMNEIKAETRGKIKEILVENGNPIEFGQPLFRIEPVS